MRFIQKDNCCFEYLKQSLHVTKQFTYQWTDISPSLCNCHIFIDSVCLFFKFCMFFLVKHHITQVCELFYCQNKTPLRFPASPKAKRRNFQPMDNIKKECNITADDNPKRELSRLFWKVDACMSVWGFK